MTGKCLFVKRSLTFFFCWFRYAARFFLCELLALGNVVGQMFMLDRFFDGEFMNYGNFMFLTGAKLT